MEAMTNEYAMDELIRSMQVMLSKLQKANNEWMRSRWARTAAEAWTEQYGELVPKTTAAKILGCSPATVYKLIEENSIKTAPNGHVLVRSMAEWASSQSPNRKAKCAPRGVKTPEKKKGRGGKENFK